MVSACRFSMPTPFWYRIPPTRSPLQAGWKRMTGRVPWYPWQLTGAPTVVTATRWFTEATCMPRNERHFVRITARSILAFWRTFWATAEDWFPCLGSCSWVVCRVLFRMVRGWCSVFCSFCSYLVVWRYIWPLKEKFTWHWWELVSEGQFTTSMYPRYAKL